MANTEDTLFTWSVAARSDFRAVTDDGKCSERFKLALAATIAQGWDNNRDKPAWALAALMQALARTEVALATCLDLLWLSPTDMLAALRDSDDPGIGRNDDGSLFLKDKRGTFRLSPFRVRLVQKLLEFVVSCDDFTHGPTVVDMLDPLREYPAQGTDPVGEATRAFAKLLYRYRETHFDDARANATFTVIRGFTKEVGDVIDDDTPFAFWMSADNTIFRTYAASFYGLRDYVAALTEAQTRAAMEKGLDAAHPGLQAELSVMPDDPFADEDDGAATAAALPEEAPKAPETAEEALKSIAEGELKIVTQKERALLSPVLQAGAFGVALPRATARLLAFHPIQSALSNGLRTGKALLPIEERVHCSEARAYGDLAQDLQALETAMTDWMKIALALRIGEDTDNPQLAEIRDAGVVLLKKKRSKSFDRAPEELAAAFKGIETGLISVNAALRDYGKALRRGFASGDDMAEAFEADRGLFRAAFSQLYLETPAQGENRAQEA